MQVIVAMANVRFPARAPPFKSLNFYWSPKNKPVLKRISKINQNLRSKIMVWNARVPVVDTCTGKNV